MSRCWEQVERHEREIAELRGDVDQTRAGVRWLSETMTAMGQAIRRLYEARDG